MTEYWIMRVIGKAREGGMSPQVAADIERGVLCVINGELCEPIESHADAERAHAKLMAMVASGRRGAEYKLTMSTDEF